MDIELARTFLEIVSTRSFVRAADRLHVAQTTVSARIRTLEKQLGRQLFVRNKAGATLTAAGEQLLRYAPTFVQLWERVRHQVAVPEGHQAVLALGSEVSLWQPLLLDWVLWMRTNQPQVALRANVDVPQNLVDQVAAGLVDAAVIYAPPHRPGLKVDLLLDEKLVMVTTADGTGPDDNAFIGVEWGPGVPPDWGAGPPGLPTRAVAFNFGPLALGYLLAAGGTGYFRLSAVAPLLQSGRLRLVPGQPRISYPIHVVYSAELEDSLIQPALAGLRTVVLGRPAPPAAGTIEMVVD